MRNLKNIFDFYIFSNIHVALATFCLTKITLLEVGISENKTPLFVFFSTLVAYNSIRFLRINTINNWFQKWLKLNKRRLDVLIILNVLILIYFTFQMRLKSIIVLFPFAVFTLFYVFPIKKYSLRDVAGLKLFLIAISWAGITVLFPLVQNYILPRTVDYITFLQRFLFVMAITLPFDIRDLNYDSSDLKTLPQQIGVNKSKFIGVSFLLLFFLLSFLKINFSISSIFILLIVAVVSSVLLLKSTTNQNKYYSAFFVELLPALWLLLIIL